jgi:4'-phosphopantetheinyl transferase
MKELYQNSVAVATPETRSQYFEEDCRLGLLSLPPASAKREIRLWAANLSSGAQELAYFASTLAADERARAERFHSPRDRDRFVIARGVLRCVLADYQQTLPQVFRFSYGPEGKPRLSGGSGPQFNLAHADDVAVYAVARDEIGIDIEYIDPDFDFAAVLETAATPREQDCFRTLPQNLRALQFFAWWTRKEAYVKALGQGFSISPTSFEVPVSPARPDVLINMNDESWKLRTFVPKAGYVATIAARGVDWRTRWQSLKDIFPRQWQSPLCSTLDDIAA